MHISSVTYDHPKLENVICQFLQDIFIIHIIYNYVQQLSFPFRFSKDINFNYVLCVFPWYYLQLSMILRFLAQVVTEMVPFKCDCHHKIKLHYAGKKRKSHFTCKHTVVIDISIIPRHSSCYFTRTELDDLPVQSKCFSSTSP